MATLYEIDAEIRAALDQAVDPETGEINEDAYALLDALEIERDRKVEAIALVYKNAMSDAEAHKAEKMSQAKKQANAEALAERMKNYLAYALQGQKFKTAKVSVSYRKSESVEVESVDALPAELLKVTVEPNKLAIKDELKAGREVAGCKLVERQSVLVK